MGRIMMFCGYKETSIFMLLICLILQRYAFSIKFLSIIHPCNVVL